jgi:hypothetical protein
MSTNRTLAVIATLASLVAAPAYAHSGRHFGQQTNIPSGAYGSVLQGNQNAQPAAPQHDFQLDGRGLGTSY